MNSPLSILGQDIADAFHEQTSCWSLPESIAPAGNAGPSPGLAQDILRLEDIFQLIDSLNQAMETRFIPDDLFTVSSGAAETPEQAFQSSQGMHQEKLPFPASPGFTGTVNRRPGASKKAERWSKDGRADSLLPGGSINSGDPLWLALPDAAHHLTSFGASEDPDRFGRLNDSPDDPVAPNRKSTIAKDTTDARQLSPDDSTTRIVSDTGALTANSIWQQPLQSLSDFTSWLTHPAIEQGDDFNRSNPVQATTADSFWQQPLQSLDDFTSRLSQPVVDQDEYTSRSNPDNATTADSFWRQPLQNLTDFTSWLTPPATEQNRHTEGFNSIQATKPGVDHKKTSPSWVGSNEHSQDNPTYWPSLPKQSITPASLLTPSVVRGLPENLASGTEITPFDAQPEPFQPGLLQQMISPDPDELLDALTERILRDFRRYYP